MSNYEKIYEFVKKNPNSTASIIAKALNIDIRRQNIYSMLKPMVKRMQLFKTRNKKYIAAPQFHIPKANRGVKPSKPVAQVLKNMDKVARRMPLYSENDRQPSALEKIFQAEIEYIDAGIESLQITRSYVQRRIEQIRADGKA